MCQQKVCPSCFKRIPARATECTTNGCHHIFDESQPNVAPIGRTWPVGTIPDATGYSGGGDRRPRVF